MNYFWIHCTPISECGNASKTNFRVLETNFNVLKTNFRVLKINFRVLETNFKVLKTNFRVLKIDFRLLEPNFKVPKLEKAKIRSVLFVSQVIIQIFIWFSTAVKSAIFAFPVCISGWTVHFCRGFWVLWDAFWAHFWDVPATVGAPFCAIGKRGIEKVRFRTSRFRLIFVMFAKE